MKKIIYIMTMAMLIACQANTPNPAPEGEPLEDGFAYSNRTYPIVAGTLQAFNIHSSEMNRTMKVDIWLPAGYKEAKHRYPVLYMHDGQNCIKKAEYSNCSWGVDRTITQLGDKIDAPIVVMIYCNGSTRNADYMPANWWELLPEGQTSITVPGENTIKKANSKEYIDFITETLKPWVDKHYATLTDATHTVVAGSSMGALVSVYAIQYRPDVFGGAMALSYPSLIEWWDWQQNTFSQQMPEANSVRLYIDTGTGELDNTFFPQYNEILPTLRAAGWDEEHAICPIYKGADHNEKAWAARLATPMTYLFEK